MRTIRCQSSNESNEIIMKKGRMAKEKMDRVTDVSRGPLAKQVAVSIHIRTFEIQGYSRLFQAISKRNSRLF